MSLFLALRIKNFVRSNDSTFLLKSLPCYSFARNRKL